MDKSTSTALKITVIFVVLVSVGYLYWRATTKSYCEQRGGCPNIVLVILDDMPWDHFGFLSGGVVQTPNIDKLAAEGFVFSNAYATNSRCRASLASLLTGKYPHQNLIYANQGVIELKDNKALPAVLSDAGYATFAGGKFWEGEPTRMKFFSHDLDTFHFVRQSQDVLENFLSRFANKKPLFVWWAPMMPHQPHNASEEFLRQVPKETIQAPFVMSAEDLRVYREEEQAYRATILWVDKEVGVLMEKLSRHAVMENTWIILLADNGWDAAFVAKGSAYDVGVRTPLLIRGPGVVPGVNAIPLTTQNIYGSILDLVGITAEQQRSASVPIIKVASGDAVLTEAPVYWASYPGYTGKSEPQPRAERDVYAVSTRSGPWQYTFYIKSYDESGSEADKAPVVIHTGMTKSFTFHAGDEELFDLQADPHSQHNLAGKKSNASMLEKFRRDTFRWWRESGGLEMDSLKKCRQASSVVCSKYISAIQ